MARRRIKAKQSASAGGGARRRRASRVPAVPSRAPAASRAPSRAPEAPERSSAPEHEPVAAVSIPAPEHEPAAAVSIPAPVQPSPAPVAVPPEPRPADARSERASTPPARTAPPSTPPAPTEPPATPEAQVASPSAPPPAPTEAPESAPAEVTLPSDPAPPRPSEPVDSSQPAFDGRRTDPAMAALSDDFFSARPPEPVFEDWGDVDLPAIDKGHQRAMHATLGILAVSLLGIGSYLVYNKVIMPTPVELTGAVAYDMPAPVMHREPVRVPAPEEAAQLRAHDPTAMAPATPAAPSPEEAADPVGGEPVEAAVPDALTPQVDEPLPTTTDTVVPAPPAESEAADDGYEQLLAEGVKLARKGRSKDALRVLEQARGLRPNGGRVLAELSFLHLNRGRNAEAAELAGRAVAVDPTISMGWIVLGAARDAKRDREGARAAYEQCATLPIDEYVRECRRLAR